MQELSTRKEEIYHFQYIIEFYFWTGLDASIAKFCPLANFVLLHSAVDHWHSVTSTFDHLITCVIVVVTLHFPSRFHRLHIVPSSILEPLP